MSQEVPTRVLRRTLEESLDTGIVSSVLFEAIGAAGNRVPDTMADVLAIVRGPLQDVLTRRLGHELALELVQLLEARLVTADGPKTVEQPLDGLASETRPEDATAAVPLAERAVRLMVLAGGRGFEHRVGVALGPGRVAPYTVSQTAALAEAHTTEPHVVLVDATDFPPFGPAELLALTQRLPATTARVLWGAELPYGRSVARAVDGADPRWVLLELREGIDPLLDLIRSRRRAVSLV